MDSGNVAEWVAGVGTVLAFGLGLWLYRGQLRDQRRDQASKVHVLTARNESYSRTEGHSGHVKYRLSNQSDLPAYEITVALISWSAKVGDKPIRTQTWESLVPNEVSKETEMPADEMLGYVGIGGPWKRAPVSIEFTDANGRRWLRMPGGVLYRRGRRGGWKRCR